MRLARDPLALVVASGKGGTGKSVLSVLLADALARAGHDTLLVDADLNLANLHVLLGVRPAGRLDQLLAGEMEAGALVRPVREGLALLAGDTGNEQLHGLDALARARLMARLTDAWAGHDAVVVDAGAGLDAALRVAALGASRLVVVTAPEPTALTDAYALLKVVTGQLPGLPLDVLVNRALDDDEGRAAYERLAAAAERFLRRGLRYLGTVPEDDAVRRAVRAPRQFLALAAAGRAGEAVRQLVTTRLGCPEPAGSAA